MVCWVFFLRSSLWKTITFIIFLSQKAFENVFCVALWAENIFHSSLSISSLGIWEWNEIYVMFKFALLKDGETIAAAARRDVMSVTSVRTKLPDRMLAPSAMLNF